MNLNKEWLEEITKAVAKENNKQLGNQRKKRQDWRLRNTSLLLKNYRKLKAHCKQSIDDSNEVFDMTENVYLDESEEIQLQTVLRYHVKTAKMLEYVDMTLNSYKYYCVNDGEAALRRYKIIESLYISSHKKNATELSEFWHIDKTTVWRDEKKAIEDLSILLFGIDSLNDLMQ